MALPTPTTFPAPAAFPSFAPTEAFGLTVADQQLQQLVPGLGGTPTFTGTPGVGAAAVQQATLQLAMLQQTTGNALPSDPRTWTVADAAAQTDRAIARIGATNPELAQKLQAQRTGQQVPDTGGGFFHSLLSGLGDVLHITHLDQVFSVLGRASHIIPEVLADEEHQSIWGNVAQALAGHSDKGWGQVLDKYGVFTGDDLLSRIAHQGLAFLGDVATDPLTYVMPGFGGLSREVAAETVGKTAFKALVENGPKELVETVGKYGEEAIPKLWDAIVHGGSPLAEEAGTRAEQIVERLHTLGVSDDALSGMAHALMGDTQRQAMLEIIGKTSTVMSHASEFGAGALGRLSPELAATLGLDEPTLSAIRGGLQDIVKGGTGLVSKSAYEQSKAAAALLGGGIKLRGSIPVFGLRFVTNELPLTGRLNFQFARQFFAGLSGYKRLTRMVESGEAGLDHLRAFYQDGFDGLKKYSAYEGDQVANRLAGGSFLHAGSILYPMSEAVGGFTKGFVPHAALLRGGGLGELVTANASRNVKAMSENIIDAIWEQKDPVTGAPMKAAETQSQIVKLFGKSFRDNPEQWDTVQQYLRLMPDEAAHDLGAAKYYESLRKGIIADRRLSDVEKADQLAVLDHRAKDALAAESLLKSYGDGVLDGVKLHRRVIARAGEVLQRNGIYDAVYADPVDSVHALNQEDALAWTRTGHKGTDGLLVTLDDPSVIDRESGRIAEQQLTDKGAAHTLRAIHGTEAAPLESQAEADAALGDLNAALAASVAEEGGATAQKAGVGILEKSREATAAGTGVVAFKPEELVRDELRALLSGAKAETTASAAAARQRFVVRLLNPFVRDLRGGLGSTSEVDVYGQVEANVRKALDIFGSPEDDVLRASDAKVLEGLSPEVRTILESALDRDAKIAEATTAQMQALGYDGVVTVGKDGRRQVSAFLTKDGPQAVKFVTSDAPRTASPDLGRLIHQLTPQVLEAVRGVLADQPIGASDAWLQNLSRQLVGRSLTEAEAKAREVLGEMGIDIGKGRVFETDPLKIASRLAHEVAGRVTNKYLGRTARRIELLGLNDTPFRGAAVGLERFKYVVNDGDFEAVSQAARDVQEATHRAAALSAKLPNIKLTADRLTEQILDLRARLRQQLDELDGYVNEKIDPSLDRQFEETYGKEVPRGAEGYAERQQKIADTVASHGRRLGIRNPAENPSLYEDLGDGVYVLRKGTKGRRVFFTGTTDAEGKFTMTGYRSVAEDGVVDTLGVGGTGLQLLKAHWKDSGVYDAADPIAAAKALVEKNTFSSAGARLNHRAIADLVDTVEHDSPAAKALAQAEAEIEAVEQSKSGILRELNKMQASLETKAAKARPALVSAENASNMTGMQRLGFAGLTDVAMPTFMAEEFRAAARGFRSLGDFHQQYRQFMSWWKTWATYMFPGFHARNFMGAWFNNWLGGVDLSDYVMASRIRRAERDVFNGGGKWTGRRVIERDAQALREMGLGRMFDNPDALRELTYNDLATLTGDLGLTASHGRAFAEARVGTEHLEEKLQKKTLFEHVPFIGPEYVKGAKGAGTMTENLFRTAAFVRGMKNTGGDVWGARAFTMLRHGDYQDLTDWEYGWIRDILPFYKWMRTNTPFQIHQLFESPGKLLAVAKARNAVWGVAGLDWNKEKYKEPEWMRDALQLPFPGKDGAFNAVMLDLPMNDLFKSGREYLSSFLPLIRPFIESYLTKQNTFTGAPIGNKAVELTVATPSKPSSLLNPLADFLAPLAPLMRAVGLGKDDAAGNLTVSESTANILNAIPIFSRFRNWIYEDPTRVKLRANGIASAVFGLGIRPVDQQSMISSELDFYYGTVEPQLEYLKSLGYPLPTTDDLKQAGLDTDTILRGLGVTPGGVAAQGSQGGY